METERRIGATQHAMSLTESTNQLKAVDAIGNGEQEVQGFAKTLAFLRAAIAEGAHLKIPFWIRGKFTGQISEDAWVRQKNIVGVYFGSPAALEDIGKMYRVTREMVRVIKDRGMRNIWRNCSSETQAIFPFQELTLSKPLSPRSRERFSRAQGGISISIRDQMALGKPVKQIREEGNHSTRQFEAARRY